MGCTACTEPQCLYKGALYSEIVKEVWSCPFIASALEMSQIEMSGQFHMPFTHPAGKASLLLVVLEAWQAYS
jgi:hypothetical protein